VLIRSTTGEQFVARCALTQTSATLRLASPIPMALPSGSSVFGIAISRALTADETEDEGKAKVAWTATVGGQTLAWTEEFEIVRRVPRWELDDDLLTQRFPEVLALRDSNDLALEELREAALEEELLPRLRAKKDQEGNPLREANIISTWPLVPAHVAACKLFIACSPGSGRTKEDRDDARSELEQKLALALEDADAWYDVPQDADPDLEQEREDFSPLFYTR
jgi:hypothetical protein